MSTYDPAADDGQSFWDRTVYGERATEGEKHERYMTVMELLHTHRTIAHSYELAKKLTGTNTPMIVNFACLDLLESVGRLLYISAEEVRLKLIDIPLVDQGRRVWYYVERARMQTPPTFEENKILIQQGHGA